MQFKMALGFINGSLKGQVYLLPKARSWIMDQKFEMVAMKVREKYNQLEEERFKKSIIIIKTHAVESKLQRKLNKSRNATEVGQSKSSNDILKPS